MKLVKRSLEIMESLEIMKRNSIGKTFYPKIMILLPKVIMQVMMIVTVKVTVTVDQKKLLFMAMSSTGAPESIANNSEDEGEVDLEGELISSLKELRKVRKKYKALKEDVKELVREKQGFEETIAKLELQIEVSKGNEDMFVEQLQEMEQIIERL